MMNGTADPSSMIWVRLAFVTPADESQCSGARQKSALIAIERAEKEANGYKNPTNRPL